MGEDIQGAPCAPGEQSLEIRAADLLSPWHVSGCGCHRHAALYQAHQVIDLPRVIAPVGHCYDYNGGRRLNYPIAYRIRRPTPVFIYDRADPGVLLRVPVKRRQRCISFRVYYDQDLSWQLHRLEDAI